MKKYLLMLFAFVASANLFAASPRYYGDINQDGKVDIADISALVEILNGKSLSSYDLLLANVDAKGDIDIADLELLVEYVLGVKPLVEYVDFDGIIYVKYNGNTATVENLPADGSITAIIDGADVTINNTITDKEITAVLSGKSTSGSYVYVGAYKTTTQLNGLTLKGSSAEAINIKNGKRNNLVLVDGTTNTIEDASTDGGQKAAIYSKGHFEISGAGTLNLVGNIKHALSAKEYIMLKKSTGTINVTSAASDGIHAGQYIKINGGSVTINGVASDGIQAEASGAADYDEDEDDGSLIITGGTLNVTISGDDADAIKCDDLLSISNNPTITITTTGSGAKGLKTNGDVNISGGTLNFTQSGGYIATMVGSEIDDSYSTSIKADKDINITGGSITIVNKANGGKGLSADGNIVINSETAILDITANGAGGILETNGTSTPTETPKSYKVYVAVPSSSNQGGMGGGPGGSSSSAWKSIYLYKNDGTMVATLSSTVSKTSGSTTKTFYYYDFNSSDSDTYYFHSDDYTSSRRGQGGSSTTYTIKSATFSGPTSGEDYYYEISNSYTTSGTTRTYSLSNVTNTWNGSTSDASEDSGESYAASGIKADGNITISAGTLTIKNSGEMSKSIKCKSTVTIDGGDITLTPSGAMKVINSDASYSTGVKAVDFVQNGGKLTITATGAASRGISATNVNTNGGTIDITNSGAGQSGTNDSYTAKGIKADTNIALNAGTITINMSGAGGKGIKSSGTYTQGTSDGEGPTLTVNTTGSSFGSSSSSSGGQFGGGPGGGGMQESSGSSAKAIKIQGAATIYGGTSEISTASNGAEGLESKTSIDIRGGKHYFKCYDDCINCSGMISFNGGLSVCYATNNDAVDSNYGRTGAITIGNGTVFAYTTAGSPEEGLDCDNNSYIVITGTGTAISAGGTQGGGGGWGGSSSSSSIGSSTQGYYLSTSSLSYKTNTYYTLADASGNNMITYSFEGDCSSSLSLFTAKGMTSGSSYTVKSSTSAPTDASTAWHGVYLGSSASGSSSLTSFTATK